MSLDHLLLGLVREPASGYDLKRLFDERIAHFWAAELSQIYPALNRLERRGLLRSRRAASKRGAGRRVYELTPAGRRELREWLSQPPSFGSERFPYLGQLFFMGELGDARRTLRFLRSVRERLEAKLAALRTLERMWAEADPRDPERLPLEDFHVYLVLRKGLVSLEASLAWCEESMDRLAARAAKDGGRRK